MIVKPLLGHSPRPIFLRVVRFLETVGCICGLHYLRHQQQSPMVVRSKLSVCQHLIWFRKYALFVGYGCPRCVSLRWARTRGVDGALPQLRNMVGCSPLEAFLGYDCVLRLL